MKRHYVQWEEACVVGDRAVEVMEVEIYDDHQITKWL